MSNNRRRRTKAEKKQVSQRIGNYKGIVFFLLLLSLIVSVLALTGAFYMLQIYDRALTSGSVPTLLAISVLAIGLYLFQGMFDVLRSQILVRVGARFDDRLAPLAHRVVVDMPRYGYSPAEALERGRDVETMRGFVSSPGATALLDLPWMPLFLVFVYLLHPMLGFLTVAGAIFLICLTFTAEFMSRGASKEMMDATINKNKIAEANTLNADIIKAMGFGERAFARFHEANSKHLKLQMRVSDISGTLGGFSKVIRMMLQSALLGLGAFLTIQGELSAGAIIAGSVAASRALAPIDGAIANWKGFVAARRAMDRLKDTLAALDEDTEIVDLPAPERDMSVEGIALVAPGTGKILINDVSFALSAGDALGLIGPSGGGKTSLVRGLVGVWPLLRGNVRLDGADLTQWTSEALGQHVGYLPQDVSLFDGSIAENISRFDPEATNEDIVAAANAAGVHDMVVNLVDGYQTQIGPQGTALSAGQRQRIALARALFRNPFLIVLDEPNSNLDADGEKALKSAIRGVRERGGIVIVIAHRPSALAEVDLVGVIQGGKLKAFGPKEEIIKAPEQPQTAPQPAPKPEVAAARSPTPPKKPSDAARLRRAVHGLRG